jgi:hypothetical protein
MPKNKKAIAEGEIAKRKKQGEQDRLTLADKIAGDQELQMLVNSGAHATKLVQDDKAKKRILQHKPPN